MNKAELVESVADQADLSRSDAANAVDAVLDSVANALANGDMVSLIGFGTFSVNHRAARTGRKPRTGETISSAASSVPKFKARKGLKDKVN